MPAVLATPWLVASLEYAARDAIAPLLDANERSVGTFIEVEHLAPAPEGFTVRCRARVIHVDGPVVTFQVEAHDGVEVIAKGLHRRRVIDVDRFARRIAKKRAKFSDPHEMTSASCRKRSPFSGPGTIGPSPMNGPCPSRARPPSQLVAALKKLGRSPYVVEGYLTRPDEAIAKLGPIDDPMIGVFVHWTYAPHTVDGVVGKDNPLLLASNFSGTWPGLVALLNTGASLESVGRAASRIWTDATDWTADAAFMERLDEWCSTGQIALPTQRAARGRRRSAPRRSHWPSRCRRRNPPAAACWR